MIGTMIWVINEHSCTWLLNLLRKSILPYTSVSTLLVHGLWDYLSDFLFSAESAVKQQLTN